MPCGGRLIRSLSMRSGSICIMWYWNSCVYSKKIVPYKDKRRGQHTQETNKSNIWIVEAISLSFSFIFFHSFKKKKRKKTYLSKIFEFLKALDTRKIWPLRRTTTSYCLLTFFLRLDPPFACITLDPLDHHPPLFC